MRVGIDGRFLSAGGMVVRRGMGRYSLQQLEQVLRLDAHDDFVLVCRRDADLAPLPAAVTRAPNLSFAWLAPLDGIAGEDLNRPARYLAALDELECVLEAAELDLFHLTTPCRLEDLVPPRLDACRIVATLYDLIPFLYRDHYFHAATEPALAEWYRRAIASLRRADRLLAISEHSRRAAVEHLGLARERIDLAAPFAEPCFAPLTEAERERRLAPLRERLPLAGEYFLAVTHLHHTKNLPGLLDAYARLAPALRERVPLVLACQLAPEERAIVGAWAAARGIAADVRATGFVADSELAALYGAATAVVHPSLYEGFGLPALEALQCGAAVVAAQASALPEVVGEAGLLCDPRDPPAVAAALERVARDPALRAQLRARAPEQASRFGPERLGRETLAAYAATCAAPAAEAKRLRLALWSPLPPQASGIADYTAELLPELARQAAIEVFVDDGVIPELALYDHAAIRHHVAFARRAARQPFDAVLFQMGASFFHLYMADVAARLPGIVTLHDLSWGAVLARLHDLAGSRTELAREVEWSDGEEAAAELARLEAAPLAERGALTEAFFNRHPVLRRVLGKSRAQIVHLPLAAQRLAERYGVAPDTFAMGVDDPRRNLAAGDPAAIRARFGLSAEAFLIGSFGIADPVKRLESLVGALARLDAEHTPAVAVVVGAFYDPRYRERISDLARALGVASRLRLLGRVARADFDRLLLACDAVVNLRWPFRQQMSATLMRALAAGRPVVVTDVAEWSHLPPEVCLRVPADETEVATLGAQLQALAGSAEKRQRMGAAARRFYETEATPARMAANYLAVIDRCIRSAAAQVAERA